MEGGKERLDISSKIPGMKNSPTTQRRFVLIRIRASSPAKGRDDEGQPWCCAQRTDSGVLYPAEVPENLLPGRLELEVLEENEKDHLCERDAVSVGCFS